MLRDIAALGAALERIRIARGYRSRVEALRALVAEADPARPPEPAPDLVGPVLDAWQAMAEGSPSTVAGALARRPGGAFDLGLALDAFGRRSGTAAEIGYAFRTIRGRRDRCGRYLDTAGHDRRGVVLWRVVAGDAPQA